MRRALALPRTRRLEGDPVVAALSALGDKDKPSSFVQPVDLARARRAAKRAHHMRLALRFARTVGRDGGMA